MPDKGMINRSGTASKLEIVAAFGGCCIFCNNHFLYLRLIGRFRQLFRVIFGIRHGRRLYKMGMFYSPAGDFIKQPKAIDTKGNDGEKPPFDIAAE